MYNNSSMYANTVPTLPWISMYTGEERVFCNTCMGSLYTYGIRSIPYELTIYVRDSLYMHGQNTCMGSNITNAF